MARGHFSYCLLCKVTQRVMPDSDIQFSLDRRVSREWKKKGDLTHEKKHRREGKRLEDRKARGALTEAVPSLPSQSPPLLPWDSALSCVQNLTYDLSSTGRGEC